MYTRFCSVPENAPQVCPNVGWLKDFNDGQSMLDPTFNGENVVPENNSNWPQLDVPEINDAINEATLIDDPEERNQAWADVDTMIIEQAPAIPYIWDDQANIQSADVAGVINKFNANWDLVVHVAEGVGSAHADPPEREQGPAAAERRRVPTSPPPPPTWPATSSADCSGRCCCW